MSSHLRFALSRIKQKTLFDIRIAPHIAHNAIAVVQGTQPGSIFFQREIQQFLGVDDAWMRETASEYLATPAAWKFLSRLRSPSRKTDGLAKTLDVAEGFALWAVVKQMRPHVVVELGTQYGLSARCWKEALRRYVPDHELFLCDLEDKRRFIGDNESTMLKGDARETLQHVFATRTIDILHNDAHPYDLIRWSVEEGLHQGVRMFSFHDIGKNHPRGVFKPELADLPQKEKMAHNEDYGTYGACWERHVIAELFDRRALSEDAVDNDACRIQFFDSLFGLGFVYIKNTTVSAAKK